MCHYALCHYAKCHSKGHYANVIMLSAIVLGVIMLRAIILSVIMLRTIILSVIMQRVITINVKAPCHGMTFTSIDTVSSSIECEVLF